MLVSFVLSSCIDEVDLSDQINEKPKLVLYCRLCPQMDSTFIMLSNTQLLYGSGSHQKIALLPDGIVELSADGEHWARATFFAPANLYLITRQEFPIEEGHTYYIRASRTGYDDVSAVCTVPYSRPVDARFDTVTVDKDVHWGEIWDMPHKDAYVQWHDYPGEDNYYALVKYYRQESYNHNNEVSYSYYMGYYVCWLEEENSEGKYFSDQGRDGQIFRYITNELLDLEDNPYQVENDKDTKYFMAFLDKNSYLYESTLSDEYGIFNNFLLEPLHTYSNIENGYGLFGAFTMQEIP